MDVLILHSLSFISVLNQVSRKLFNILITLTPHVDNMISLPFSKDNVGNNQTWTYMYIDQTINNKHIAHYIFQKMFHKYSKHIPVSPEKAM